MHVVQVKKRLQELDSLLLLMSSPLEEHDDEVKGSSERGRGKSARAVKLKEMVADVRLMQGHERIIGQAQLEMKGQNVRGESPAKQSTGINRLICGQCR